jgi:sugar/nucleoside kinase (ribokinase family)
LKVRVDRVVRQGGGPAANAAVGLARLGASVAWAGAVGADALGRAQLDELAEERVDVSAASVIDGIGSFVSFILVDRASGSRTIFSAPGGRPLAPAENARLPAPLPHLLLIDGWGGPAQRRVAELARAAGVPVLLDAGSLRDDILEIVPLAEVVIASTPFADALSGSGRHDAALATIRAMGPRLVAITRGEKGCLAVAGRSGDPFEVAAFPVQVVDTTGAGDAFHAGAAWALLRGKTWGRALEFGAAVAACKCRREGAREGLPRAGEVDRFLDTPGVPG